MSDNSLSDRRLELIHKIISQALESTDMLVSTAALLKDVSELTGIKENEEEERTIISTYSKFLPENNEALVSWVYLSMNGKLAEYGKFVPSKSGLEAALDAVYEGLVSYFGLFNTPSMPIEIESDNWIVEKILTNEMYITESEGVKRKHENILELCKELPVDIYFSWVPRVGSITMKRAANLVDKALE